MERIEKQLEGNSLALSAVAEVLAKMDGRLSRDEEFLLAKQEQEEAAADRSSLIKEIASEVAGILKDGDAGLDVDGEKVRPAAKTGKSGADDSEKPAPIKTNISDQQATIQAMVKAFMKAEEDDKAEEYPVDEKKGGMRYKAEDSEEEDEEDVSKEGNGEADEEDEEVEKVHEEDDEDDAEKSLAKQLDALKKQVAAYEANMSKSIKGETESRLRKMGFREDNGLQRPTQTNPLGVDGTTPIKKQAAQGDMIDQLTTLSYKELRDLQVNIEKGNTEGLPRELVGR